MNTPYRVKMINGAEFDITAEERQTLLTGKGAFAHLARLDATIALSGISIIAPQSVTAPKVDRTKQLMGVTPDGDVVEKRYGVWYISKPNNPYQYDDSGQSILRYEGSPLLPTPEEYESTYKHLPVEAWTSKLIGQSSEVDDRLLIDHANRTTRGGFEKIDSTFVPRISPEDAEL